MFAPVGYLVIGFPGDAEAVEARQAPLTGGYEEAEAMMFTAPRVVADIESNRDDVSCLSRLGAEIEHQAQHLAWAKQGGAFLAVSAPSEPETARAINVARRFHARLAHKDDRFTVEEIL